MANAFASQCNKLLNAFQIIQNPPHVTPSISIDELCALSHAQGIRQSEQEYTAHGLIDPASACISPDDLDDLLNEPPLLPQDIPYLSAQVPGIDIDGCDDWSLPSTESFSSWETPDSCLFMHQTCHAHIDHHSAHDLPNEYDAQQPVWGISRCGENNVPARENWSYGGSSIEEELIKGAASPPPNAADQQKAEASPSHPMGKGMGSASTKLPLQPSGCRVKKRKLMSDPKPMDLSECSNATEDDEDNRLLPDGQMSGLSKNLLSERKRRMRLKERLYSLRALVPRVSKMDRASILGDAINHVQELQKQLKSTQGDILALQRSAKYPSHDGQSGCVSEDIATQHIQMDIPQHKILEMHVSSMDPKMHQLRIHCKRQPGVIVQLAKALEALNLDIVSASLTAVSGHVLNTVVIKADGVLKSEDFKEMLMRSFSTYGLHF